MEWWKQGVVYQIYPRSFMDANGDGVGDLRGIAARAGHLAWLGIDAVWLSPIFASPMVDMGYDVADYRAVDPAFGSMDDLDALVHALHDAGIRLLLDLVPNHTSDRHPWFVESRASRTGAKRDWYLWSDPAPDGGPPNNWMSVFGGSAWERDATTGQFYYHAYLKEQPDLNWRNPAVEAAMHEVVRFWLARGIDGFRVDVIWHLVKDAALRDNPVNPEWREGMPDARKVLPLYTTDRPEVHPTIARLRRVFDEFRERVMVGEIYLPVETLAGYYGTPDWPECHLPFNFSLVWPRFEWSAAFLADTIVRYEKAIAGKGWPNWVLGNHDVARIASRVGAAQAKVAAVLLLTLRGTPTIYQGDELGIANVEIPPDRVSDTRERTQPGHGRDPVRTPMPWTGAPPGGGFTDAIPWLPLNADLATRNVEAMKHDPDSILCLYRRLLHLRRAEPALAVGGMEDVRADGNVLRWTRTAVGTRFEIALNLASEPATIRPAADRGTIVLSTLASRDGSRTGASVPLEANEAIVLRLEV